MLHTQISRLHFKNPIILASGILGVSASILTRLAKKHGIGGLTTKSIGPVPRKGNLNPSIIEIDTDTYLNAVGLANPGIDELLREIPEIEHDGVPLIASIFGDTDEQYAEIASKVERAGVDAVELNISCPHAKVSCIGADQHLTYGCVKAVKQAVSIPVLVKLNPNVNSIVEIGKSAESAGADAGIAINTVRGMAIDIEVKRPILANKSGGISGRAIKPVAIKAVYDLYEALNIPVIGCGGIFSGADVIEFFLAGATAVQVGTAFIKGFDVISSITAGMMDYLHEHDIKHITDLIGKAHEM
nr:dihydroorotate dehydrogenase [Candidatus Sigynarchaeota archaeon]